MSDVATPPPVSESVSEPEADAPTPSRSTTINDQVRDALRQVDGVLNGQAVPFAAAATLQALAHSVALGMHNAVARQQHSHMLRSALVTAAARALIDGKREEAEAVLKLVESPLVNPNIAEELFLLQTAMRNALGDMRHFFDDATFNELNENVAAFSRAATPATV